MSLLSWTPSSEHHDPGFRSLEALSNVGARYTVASLHDSADVIDGWSLSRELDGITEDLGRFNDATSAQLEASSITIGLPPPQTVTARPNTGNSY